MKCWRFKQHENKSLGTSFVLMGRAMISQRGKKGAQHEWKRKRKSLWEYLNISSLWNIFLELFFPSLNFPFYFSWILLLFFAAFHSCLLAAPRLHLFTHSLSSLVYIKSIFFSFSFSYYDLSRLSLSPHFSTFSHIICRFRSRNIKFAEEEIWVMKQSRKHDENECGKKERRRRMSKVGESWGCTFFFLHATFSSWLLSSCAFVIVTVIVSQSWTTAGIERGRREKAKSTTNDV